jgi:hypothetical protein
MDPRTLQHQFGITQFVTQRNLEGITHEESLVHPVAAGNCVNWVLGHIVRTRNEALAMLGRESLYEKEMFAAYGQREGPLAEDEAVSFARLVECFDELQGPLMEGLGQLTPEALAQSAPFSPTANPDETVGSLLSGISFHEAYHAGQIGILRRVVGRPGAIQRPG